MIIKLMTDKRTVHNHDIQLRHCLLYYNEQSLLQDTKLWFQKEINLGFSHDFAIPELMNPLALYLVSVTQGMNRGLNNKTTEDVPKHFHTGWCRELHSITCKPTSIYK